MYLLCQDILNKQASIAWVGRDSRVQWGGTFGYVGNSLPLAHKQNNSIDSERWPIHLHNWALLEKPFRIHEGDPDNWELSAADIRPNPQSHLLSLLERVLA